MQRPKYDSAIEELGMVAVSLLKEREEEEHRLQSVLKDTPIKQRRDEGLCWYPTSVSKIAYDSFGNPMLTMERPHGEHPDDEFHRGSPVFLIQKEDPSVQYKAQVKKIDANTMELTLMQDEVPEGIRDHKWSIELRFDDRSYFEMERALNVAINLESGEQRELRDRILGYRLLQDPLDFGDVEIDGKLNPSQRKAVKAILESRDVCVVHGPPGTGKTTTLIESIRHLHKDHALLVCAPSNAAVDHLVQQCVANRIDALRVGSLSRMKEEVHPFTIQAEMERQPQFKTLKDLRKRAEEAFNKATQFKRSFGQKERQERGEWYREQRALEKEARELERYLEQSILDRKPVICCTMVGASDVRIRNRQFDCLFIDEAGQSLEPACWIPILKADRVVMAGDPYQLPPTVKSEGGKGLEYTLLEKAMDRLDETHLLEEQYRMNEQIMGFSNQYFYDGKLSAHPDNAHRALKGEELSLEFIDTAGCGYDEKQRNTGTSRRNEGEAELLRKHLEELLSKHDNEIDSIGVISPYRAQVEWLEEVLPKNEKITLQSVDGFQGQERDVIYISLVRSNEGGELGFLKDYRRMNVAMTRAKRKLVVIGDSATFGGDPFYSQFLDYCEKVGAYRSAWEWM